MGIFPNTSRGNGVVFGHGRTPCFVGNGVLGLFRCVSAVVLCMSHMIPWLRAFSPVCLHFFLVFLNEIKIAPQPKPISIEV